MESGGLRFRDAPNSQGGEDVFHRACIASNAWWPAAPVDPSGSGHGLRLDIPRPPSNMAGHGPSRQGDPRHHVRPASTPVFEAALAYAGEHAQEVERKGPRTYRASFTLGSDPLLARVSDDYSGPAATPRSARLLKPLGLGTPNPFAIAVLRMSASSA
jgi:hypothetical protein